MPNGDWTPPKPIQPAPLCRYSSEIGLPDHANGPCDYDPDEVQARINAAVAAERERMRATIADDAYAVTFQSMGQYRSALLRALMA